MNPELANEPHVIAALAVLSLITLGIQTWRKRHD